MTELPDLKQLTDEAKDALIVALWEELQKLRQKKGVVAQVEVESKILMY